ncbi:MAG: hypothetical protein HQL53_14915, partial [Magnetococcales bacterium]|nr:hypothetical protein [Magnetococcales bacterium]
IGSPRYTEYWAERLARQIAALDHPVINRKSRVKDQPFVVLYLPSKHFSYIPGKETWHEQSDRQIIGLLDQFSDLQLMVKPHPRSGHQYNVKKLKKYSSHLDRMELYDPSVDTSILVQGCDLLITHGSSVLTHALWVGKPVILMNEWIPDTLGPLLLREWCYRIGDLQPILQSLMAGETVPHPKEVDKLRKHLQLGMDKQPYEQTLATIVTGALSDL